MIKGTTSTGFAFEFDPVRLDDMRFVDMIVEADAPETGLLEKAQLCTQLIEMLIGKEGKRALFAHIGSRYEGGRVPRADLEQALSEIITAAGKDAEKN